MKSDKILDAMNLIDDKWIEPVERLRNETPFLRIMKRLPWEYMKVAACIGIFVLGIYVLDHWWIFDYRTFTEEVQDISDKYEQSESWDEVEAYEDKSEEGRADGEDITDSVVDAQQDFVRSGTVAVVIKEWQEDGFVGTVTDLMDLKEEDVGNEIMVYADVRIDAYTKVEAKAGEKIYYTQGMPNQQYLPAGTEVYVNYDHWSVSYKVENGIRIEEIRVWADMIERVE